MSSLEKRDYEIFLENTAKFIGIPVSFFFVLLLQSPRIVNWLARENIYPATQAGDYPVIASYCLGAFLSFVLFEFIARSRTTGKNSQEVPYGRYFLFKAIASLVFHITIVWPSFFGVLALFFATYHFFTLQPVHYIMLPVSLIPFLIHLALFIPVKIWYVIPDYVYNNKLDRRKKLEEERQEEKRQEERRAEEESLAQEKTALLTEEKGESAESKEEVDKKPERKIPEPQRRKPRGFGLEGFEHLKNEKENDKDEKPERKIPEPQRRRFKKI